MPRSVPLDLLDVRIASPCPMQWDEMNPVGDGAGVRHCDQCDLHVYNLSAMTTAESRAFLDAWPCGQRLCAGFFRRADGTIITRDCPVGLRAARLRLARAFMRVAAALAFLATGGTLAWARNRVVQMPGLNRVQPFATLCAWVQPPKPPSPITPPMPSAAWTGGVVCEGP